MKALLATTALLLLLALAPAAATVNTIQPGDAMSSSIGGCTLNFVFDGVGAHAGKVFIGTAAHCVANVGDLIDSSPYADFGAVAAIGSAGAARTDWALIEVKAEHHHRVLAFVKGHPDMPTGVATRADTGTGDLVQLSGYGMVFGTTAPTQERRVGVIVDYTATEHRITAPVVFGDSGGPLVNLLNGKAFGLNSRIPIGCPCSELGPTIEGMILQAAAKGITVEMRTV